MPEKVNIRGLDDMSTDDIHKFAHEHFPAQEPTAIQWVNDTSANIVYPTSDLALEAVLAFAVDTTLNLDSAQMLSDEGTEAKRLSSRPATALFVRIAQTTDVKKQNAREASRFYLMNPDKDPREQREQRRRDVLRRKRRRDEDNAMRPFDVSMYDDPPASASRLDLPLSDRRARRRNSEDLFIDRSRPKRTRRGEDDLFAGRLSTRSGSERLRDRSASPRKAYAAGDGRYGFSEDAAGAPIRQRSVSPGSFQIRGAASRKHDLLPAAPARRPPDLFLAHPAPPAGRKGSTSSQHRRMDAMDADDDTTHSPLPNGRHIRSLADRITIPVPGRSLEDRISRGNAGASLEDRISRPPAARDNPGFQIRGVAGAAKVKELFPDAANGPKEDLFARIGNRATRRRAGDLFG